jgi:hypothetical protein
MVSRASASEYNCLPDEILLHHVFPKLGAADRVVLSSIDRRTRELVQGEERGGSCRLRVFDFVTSVARLRWALEHGCRWNELICAAAAAGGHIGVLQQARDQEPPCPWDLKTCAAAARGGHLEVLQWVREQKPSCLLNEEWTCSLAALRRPPRCAAVGAGAGSSLSVERGNLRFCG